MQVGDVLVRDLADEGDVVDTLPAGAVVRDPEGKLRVLADRESDVFLFTDHGAAPGGSYEIVLLPEETETDPVEELARELWTVRNNVMVELYGRTVPEDGEMGYVHREIYRGLAFYILKTVLPWSATAEKPSRVVVDGGGDVWYLCPNGNYSMLPGNPHATLSYARLGESYGPLASR